MIIKKILVVLVVYFNCLYAEELRLGSWNVRAVETTDSLAGNAWSKRLPQIVNSILFSDFDIIGLQEADSAQTAGLGQALNNYHYFLPNQEKINPIFFKRDVFDVLDSGFFWLSQTEDIKSRGWNARSFRTCVWLKLVRKGSEKVFFVFNTHWDRKSVEARQQSALQMLKKIPSISENYPWFYFGDLNAQRQDESLKSIEKSGYAFFASDSAKYLYNPNGSYNYYDYQKKSKYTFDYLIYNGSISILRYGILNLTYWDGEVMRVPSDHHPIFVHANLE